MPQFPNIVPLGKMTITTAGITVALSVNCGQQQGQVPTYGTTSPPVSGKAMRQIVIMADKANTLNIYVLPKGKTLSSNPGLIIAAIPPGTSQPIPFGVSDSSGYLPENFVLDTDTNGNIAYGFGVIG